MNEPSKGVLLVVDDEPAQRAALGMELTQAGYLVLEAGDATSAVSVLQHHAVDAVIGGSSSDAGSLRLIDEIKRSSPRTPLILVSACESVSAAVAAIKRGAYDYLIKPVRLAALLEKLEGLRASEQGSSQLGIGEEMVMRSTGRSMSAFQGFSWPGNPREMNQAVERAIGATTGEVTREFEKSTPPSATGGTQGLTETIAGIERGLIDAALQHAAGNQARAAQLLGIPRTTLRDKMAKYGMANSTLGRRATSS